MKRRLFNIFSALSLLLFVAVGLLWIRSYWIGDSMDVFIPHLKTPGCFHHQTFSNSGTTMLGLSDTSYLLSSKWFEHRTVPSRPSTFTNTLAKRWGFGYWHQPTSGGVYWAIRMPHWVPMLAAALLPATWLWQERARRRRQRIERGLCLICGYDLRASKDRCPECGTPIPATTRATVSGRHMAGTEPDTK